MVPFAAATTLFFDGADFNISLSFGSTSLNVVAPAMSCQVVMLVGEPTVPPQNWVKLLSAFFCPLPFDVTKY